MAKYVFCDDFRPFRIFCSIRFTHFHEFYLLRRQSKVHSLIFTLPKQSLLPFGYPFPALCLRLEHQYM